MLHDARMSAIFTREPKTFNNILGFERDFWDRKTGPLARGPKKEGFWSGCVANENRRALRATRAGGQENV